MPNYNDQMHALFEAMQDPIGWQLDGADQTKLVHQNGLNLNIYAHQDLKSYTLGLTVDRYTIDPTHPSLALSSAEIEVLRQQPLALDDTSPASILAAGLLSWKRLLWTTGTATGKHARKIALARFCHTGLVLYPDLEQGPSHTLYVKSVLDRHQLQCLQELAVLKQHARLVSTGNPALDAVLFDVKFHDTITIPRSFHERLTLLALAQSPIVLPSWWQNG